MYRMNEIRLRLDQDKRMIPDLVRRKLNARDLVMKNITIVRESVDARNKNNIKLVYTIDFDSNISLPLKEAPDLSYQVIRPEKKAKRPVVAGFGPCGIFCALVLAEAGMEPIVLERGKKVAERKEDVDLFWKEGRLDTESNVQFGEGGAGTFSDGKLTTGIKDNRIRKVLEEFCGAGAPGEILYKQRPHIGTDVLRGVIKEIREKIIALGGEIRFGTKMTGIRTENDQLFSVIAGGEEIVTDDLVLAVGHSARDTFAMLNDMGIPMEQKPFSIGVRVQHPQKMINRAQYGDHGLANVLGPAEYKLSHHLDNGRGVYTFCMCPGGKVIAAASETGGLVTNGMSYSARDGKYANSGLLVDVRPEDFGSDDVLAGVEFQRRYERLAFAIAGGYVPPLATWEEFEGSDVMECLPGFASSSIMQALPVMGRKLKGFDDPRTMMFAVETRSSSPVRMMRNDDFMSSVAGIYPGGEGAGHAGGIMSAAVDGIKIAESIARRYR